MENEKIPYCQKHKQEPLIWICIEKNCKSRLLCQYCAIINHMNQHRQLIPLEKFIQDPFFSLKIPTQIKFQNETLILNSNEEEFCKKKIQAFAEEEEDKLSYVFADLINLLQTKVEEIKINYKEDVNGYYEILESKKNLIQKSRENLIKKAKEENIFNNVITEENLKNSVNKIVDYYYNNKELQEAISQLVSDIPQPKQNNLEIKFENRNFDQLDWNYFMDKSLVFTNENFTVKKNGGNATTLIGDKIFETGQYVWRVRVDQLSGDYICLGIIKEEIVIRKDSDMYTSAHCVCSDLSTYNINHVSGNLSYQTGDEISFNLDMDNLLFTITGPNSKYLYNVAILKGKKYRAYFGFSFDSFHKLSLIF